MQRVVIDSNVLLSALVFGGKPWAVVSAGLSAKFTPLTSHFISEELKRGLIKLGHSAEEAEALVSTYESVAELVYIEDIAPISRDPNDDPILATARYGGADVIVTGDKDLLILKRYKDIKITTPAEFMSATAG